MVRGLQELGLLSRGELSPRQGSVGASRGPLKKPTLVMMGELGVNLVVWASVVLLLRHCVMTDEGVPHSSDGWGATSTTSGASASGSSALSLAVLWHHSGSVLFCVVPAVVFLLLRRLRSSTVPTPPSIFKTYFLGHMLDGQVDLLLRHRWYAQQQELLGPVFRCVLTNTTMASAVPFL